VRRRGAIIGRAERSAPTGSPNVESALGDVLLAQETRIAPADIADLQTERALLWRHVPAHGQSQSLRTTVASDFLQTPRRSPGRRISAAPFSG
jgi:hypothetical protein